MNCCRALIVNLQKVFYNSQASVGDRQYTSLLFISTIFCPQYLTMLMTVRGSAIIFCRSLAPPMTPPPQTLQYLTILMIEKGGAIIILYPPPNALSPHDSKILYYLNDRDERRYFCRILALFNAPTHLP